jgi:hypothetical protein
MCFLLDKENRASEALTKRAVFIIFNLKFITLDKFLLFVYKGKPQNLILSNYFNPSEISKNKVFIIG